MRRFLFVFVVLFLVVSSWATCREFGTGFVTIPHSTCNFSSGVSNCSEIVGSVHLGCSGCASVTATPNGGYPYFCVLTTVSSVSCNYFPTSDFAQISYLMCDTKAEADSVNCALNPTADGCVTCADTTYTTCRNEYIVDLGGSGGYWAAVEYQVTLHACSDGTGEAVAEKRGSELPNVDCRENPFGSDPDSSKADSMRCVGQIGPNCIIQVGPNQSFMCPCEGCEYLSKTCSDIMDSLSRSSSSRSSSSASEPSESSSSQGGSSGSEGGSSGSEGGEGGSSGSGGATSSGIDYSGQLKKIQDTLDAVRNNTAITAGFVQSIDNKMNVINNTFENGTTVITDALGNVVNTIVDELHDGWTIIGDGQERILDAITDSSGIGQVPSAPSTVDTAEIDSTVEVPEPDTIVRPDSSYVDADSLVASIFSSVDTLTGDSLLAELDSMSSWLGEPDTSEIESLIASKNDALDDTISDAIDDGVDSLNAHYYSPFDSIVDATFVGMQNTNDCPESCWKFTADVPFTFHTLKIDFDFSDYLCGAVPISFLSNHGVLYFLKIVLRLVTAFFACFLIARYMKDVLIK